MGESGVRGMAGAVGLRLWGTTGKTRARREESIMSGVACALRCQARPALSLLFLKGLSFTLHSSLASSSGS